MGGLAGVISPTFAGMMTPDSTLQQWRTVFWVTFGINAIRTIVYSLWASGEIQPWNEPENVNTFESQKITETEKESTIKNQYEDSTISCSNNK